MNEIKNELINLELEVIQPPLYTEADINTNNLQHQYYHFKNNYSYNCYIYYWLQLKPQLQLQLQQLSTANYYY